MVNFGPLAAEIDSVVWGNPANFNGFRVLAALLHGTPAVGVSQTLRRWTDGATYSAGRPSRWASTHILVTDTAMRSQHNYYIEAYASSRLFVIIFYFVFV